jgi:hypothetical protein
MGSPMDEVVRGYTKLATSLVEQWGEHAAEFAEKLDGGEMDSSAIAAELVSCTTLATRSGLEMVDEAMEAAAILTGGLAAEKFAESETYYAPAGSTLTIVGELELGAGLGSIEKSAVTIESSQSDSGDIEFKVRVDTTGLRGGTYFGFVDKGPDDPEPILVWITIP